MQQGELWDNRKPTPLPPLPALAKPDAPCPGCGAKPGQWEVGRFARVFARWGLRALCVECALIPEVVREHIHQDDPQREADQFPCPYPIGSEERIDWMSDRLFRGKSLYLPGKDDAGPAPHKLPTGPPEKWHDPGETGVEKCGSRWRCRPFWRGRKWSLGVFDTEGEAIDRAREFWFVHGDADLPPPILWLPTGDEDGAIAVEKEHLREWSSRPDMAGLFTKSGKNGRPVHSDAHARQIIREYRAELRLLRRKPPTAEVWLELEHRLAAAAGPTLFGRVAEADESAGYPLGV